MGCLLPPHFIILNPALKLPVAANVFMRLSQVLVVVAVSFLVASEAFSTTKDPNQAQTVTSSGEHRPLRTHNKVVEDDDSSSDERAITDLEMKTILKDMGIWDVVKKTPNKLLTLDRYEEYRKKANQFMESKGKTKKAPMIERERYY
ncbi:unnamed protein product [Phytophthora fragariaefolia]|uniref:RxLR effector protein n=1 Tax=Phytophthora fragariaefolia TaxID=1490495 RepID=A0A9W6U3Y5_9STRA|nr:unnamed protein product [Phytophthora fragariaefolia]